MPAYQTPEEQREAAFAQFQQKQPDRASALGQEIEAIMRGDFVPIRFDMDPISAYYIAGAVDLALTHPAHTPGPKVVLEQVYMGLADALRRQFPELSRQLSEGYRQRHADQPGGES